MNFIIIASITEQDTSVMRLKQKDACISLAFDWLFVVFPNYWGEAADFDSLLIYCTRALWPLDALPRNS